MVSNTGTNLAPAVRERILCGRDYSCSLRTHCARLNVPRSEWIYYFVQGLLPEIQAMLFYSSHKTQRQQR